jgi:GT2 family glycosyltransferase
MAIDRGGPARRPPSPAEDASKGSHTDLLEVTSQVSETNPSQPGSHVSDPSRADFKLTVGIATRNRPQSLVRCLNSIALIDDLVGEVIVVDDSSDAPVGPALRTVSSAIAGKMRLVEQSGAQGYIVARNAMVRLAANDCVFMLDDDAYVIDGMAIRQAVDVFRRHPAVGAVACAQAEADGSPWPAGMQPSRVAYVCYVAAYIGFAHLLRRSVFLDLGGYQESFRFYGEEKDYCLRLLDAGYDVVYLPDARVAHVPDPSGRSETRYLRYVVRNDCLSALYNEPLPMLLLSVPVRLLRYLAMRRHGHVNDPGGLRWIAGELVKALPGVWRGRRPMRWASIRRWRRLSRDCPRFVSSAAPSV